MNNKNTANNYYVAIKDFVEKNYQNPKLSVNGIANTFGLNRTYMYCVFKKQSGVSIKQCIIKTRISNAIPLLLNGKKVSETAILVGYNDSFNFSKMFKRITGKNPIEYMKKV